MKIIKSLITSLPVKLMDSKKKTKPVIQGMVVATGLLGGLYYPGERSDEETRSEGGEWH